MDIADIRFPVGLTREDRKLFQSLEECLHLIARIGPLKHEGHEINRNLINTLEIFVKKGNFPDVMGFSQIFLNISDL